MIDISKHDINGISIGKLERRTLPSTGKDYYYRLISILDDKGEEILIRLYSDIESNLDIQQQ